MSSMYHLATLEVVVDDGESGPCMALLLGSYAIDATVRSEHGEGYWVPPNVAYPVPYGFTAPTTHGSLRRRFEGGCNRDRLAQDVEQLAYTFGLRDVDIAYRGGFIEVKNSPRTPELIRAFYIDRFALIAADPDSLVNLADPESRHGIVFIPLVDADRHVHHKESASHGRSEAWFLGKPLQSNIEHVVFDATINSQLRSTAVTIPGEAFVSQENGLICVGDVSGYGAALQYAREEMRSFAVSNAEIRQVFRSCVISELEAFVCRIETTQVQFAGDGFLTALPVRVHGDAGDAIPRLVEAWDLLVARLRDLNESIADAQRKIGSRLAVVMGDYRYGRMSKLRSFAPAFDGDEVIRAARLEQALNVATKVPATCEGDDGETGLDPRGHYIVADLADASVVDALDNAPLWSRAGSLEVGVKEFGTKAVVYEHRDESVDGQSPC